MVQVHVSLRRDLFDASFRGMRPQWHEEIKVSLWEIYDNGKKKSWYVCGERSKGMFLADSAIAEVGRRVGQGLKEWKATSWMICIHGGYNLPNYNPGPNETFPVLSAHRLEIFQESLGKEFRG